MAKSNTRTGHRSASTGRFVTAGQAKRNPAGTVRESIPKPGRGDTGRGKKG